MTNSSYVLVVSTVADVATDVVVKCLAERSIPFLRINTEDYPFSRTLVVRPESRGDIGWMQLGDEIISLPTCVWYRRLRSPAKPDGMDAGIYEFCLQENRATLLGGILGITSSWMSHPSAIWEAEHKPLQLLLAAKVGLAIPKTIITNDPSAIRKAFANFRSMVVKPARSGYVKYDGQELAIYTSRVLQEHLDHLDEARWSPAIYQELIPKRFDIRVTIVGKKVFAAAIDSQSDPRATIDWRQTDNPQLPHYPVELPPEIVSRLLELMELLGLKFGAIDLIQTPTDDYVFLEVNPSGQWLWIDDALELGISDAIADWLSDPVSD